MSSALTIQLIKRAPPKRPLLRCVRADGSETIAEMIVGPEHDLAHFAVETTLGYQRAFFGLLADGMAIGDFNVPGASRALDIPAEAALTEFIVGLLQIERRNGSRYEGFNAELARTVATSRRPPNAPVPEISDGDLRRIRDRLDELMGRWIGLEQGGTLELRFPVCNA